MRMSEQRALTPLDARLRQKRAHHKESHSSTTTQRSATPYNVHMYGSLQGPPVPARGPQERRTVDGPMAGPHPDEGSLFLAAAARGPLLCTYCTQHRRMWFSMYLSPMMGLRPVMYMYGPSVRLASISLLAYQRRAAAAKSRSGRCQTGMVGGRLPSFSPFPRDGRRWIDSSLPRWANRPGAAQKVLGVTCMMEDSLRHEHRDKQATMP